MQHQAELQELSINQLLLLNSFTHIKSEILALVIKPIAPERIKVVKTAIHTLDDTLHILHQQWQPQAGESKSERTLRLRGLNVLAQQVRQAVHSVRDEIENLEGWIYNQKFEPWEKEILQKTVASLHHITQANLYVLCKPVEDSEFANPF